MSIAQRESDLVRAVGQLLVGGFPGEHDDPQFRSLVEAGIVGGAILFSRNLSSVSQAATLVSELRAIRAPERLWISVDQEGGRVQRLQTPFPQLPPMRAFGESKKKTLVQRAGHLIGSSLALVGFDQN